MFLARFVFNKIIVIIIIIMYSNLSRLLALVDGVSVWLPSILEMLGTGCFLNLEEITRNRVILAFNISLFVVIQE